MNFTQPYRITISLTHITIFAILSRSCPGRVAALQCAVLFAALKRTNIKTMVNKETQESSLSQKQEKRRREIKAKNEAVI